jgi:hypothetical protein
MTEELIEKVTQSLTDGRSLKSGGTTKRKYKKKTKRKSKNKTKRKKSISKKLKKTKRYNKNQNISKILKGGDGLKENIQKLKEVKEEIYEKKEECDRGFAQHSSELYDELERLEDKKEGLEVLIKKLKELIKIKPISSKLGIIMYPGEKCIRTRRAVKEGVPVIPISKFVRNREERFGKSFTDRALSKLMSKYDRDWLTGEDLLPVSYNTAIPDDLREVILEKYIKKMKKEKIKCS